MEISKQIFNYEYVIKFLLEINQLNFTNDSFINKIMDVVAKYYKADFCIWHRTKSKSDFLDLNKYDFSNLERVKVLKLDNLYGEESFLIINPRIDIELEDILTSKLKGLLENISKHSFEVDDLKNDMFTDTLTRVCNFEAFQKKVAIKEYFENVGVCFIDVNGLGIVNNLHGHLAGDKMLIDIADIICQYIDKNDVYRKSGDEFIIVSEFTSEEDFNNKINKINNELPKYGYSASFGIVYKNKTNNIKEMIREADELMYIEKEKYREENPSRYSITRK